MQRFFFHQVRADRRIEDPEGSLHANLESAKQEQVALAEQVGAAGRRVDEARAAVDAAATQESHLRTQNAVAQRDLEACHEQMARFEEVGSAPTCPYCGQQLTSEHLARERSRLEQASAAAFAAAQQAFGALTASQVALQTARANLDAQEGEHTRCQAQLGECEERCRHWDDTIQRSQTEGLRSLTTCRQHTATLSLLPQASEINACFEDAAPVPEEVFALRARVASLAAHQKSLKVLRSQMAECERAQSRRSQIETQLQPLLARYPVERVQEIQADYSAANAERNRSQEIMAQVEAQLKDAERTLTGLEQQLQRGRSDLLHAQQEAQTAAQLAQESENHCSEEIAALDAVWAARARDVNAGQIAQWQAELETLAEAPARLEALTMARSQIALIKGQLGEIDAEMAAIAPEARQPLELLEQEEAQTRREQALAQSSREAAAFQLHVMQERQQQIKRLGDEIRSDERRSRNFSVIAKYLGRDYLQRYLLQQAERTIVGRANDVLNLCSGGMLSMELRPNSEVGGQQKAFELMVENRATQTPREQLLPAWLLSGSQRFRVAISLALGIGEYAGANGHGIKSVIIDEGFGSLDRQGLRDMEDALRSLSDSLGRIILVSHQDEFASIFPHRYRIALADGASTASLVDAEAMI